MDLKVIIVDDELLARDMLAAMLKQSFANVEVVDICENIPEAVKNINKYKPDIVFLDIDMPGYKGLDVVDFFDELFFKIVFTTANQQYAIDAIKMNAFDYLLKPINKEDVQNSLQRLDKEMENSSDNMMDEGNRTLLVSTSQQIYFIKRHDIVYFKAEGAYTKIVMTDQTIVSSKNLKHYETLLEGTFHFFRCHKSYILNKTRMQSLSKSKQEITMDNGHTVLLSLDKMDDLLSTS